MPAARAIAFINGRESCEMVALDLIYSVYIQTTGQPPDSLHTFVRLYLLFKKHINDESVRVFF